MNKKMQKDPDEPEFSISNKEIEKKTEELIEKTHEITERSHAPKLPGKPKIERPKILKRREDNNSQKGIALGLAVAYSLLSPVILGWIIGFWLDYSYQLRIAELYGILIGVIVGIIAVILVLVRFNGWED